MLMLHCVVSSTGVDDAEIFSVIVCESYAAPARNITCPDQRPIQIVAATFGRSSAEVCKGVLDGSWLSSQKREHGRTLICLNLDAQLSNAWL